MVTRAKQPARPAKPRKPVGKPVEKPPVIEKLPEPVKAPAFADENRPISRQFGQLERIEKFINEYEILCQAHGIEIRPELYFKPQPEGLFGVGARLVAVTVGGN